MELLRNGAHFCIVRKTWEEDGEDKIHRKILKHLGGTVVVNRPRARLYCEKEPKPDLLGYQLKTDDGIVTPIEIEKYWLTDIPNPEKQIIEDIYEVVYLGKPLDT